MHRIKKFFRTVWLHSSDVSAYRTALAEKPKESKKYLYALLYCLSLVSGIVIAGGMAAFYPVVRAGIAELKTTAPTLYPEKLVVTVKNGELSTNVKEPYAIPFPEKWRAFLTNANKNNSKVTPNMVVIDTRANVEDYAQKDTMILVTKRAIVYPGKTQNVSGKDEFQPQFKTFDPTENRVINRAEYDKILAQVMPYAGTVSSFYWVAVVLMVVAYPFLAAASWFVWLMFSLLFLTAILWVIAKLTKRPMPYWTLFQLGTYGLTVPVLATIVLGFVGIHFSWLFTLIFLAWMTYVLSHLPSKASAKVMNAKPKAKKATRK